MSIEGTFIQGCPIPGEPSQDPHKITITTVASTYPDQDYVQGLINTVAQMQAEIDTQKQAIRMALSYMTAKQLEALNYMATLMKEDKGRRPGLFV